MFPAVATAQAGGIFPGLSVLSEADVRQAAIAFVNMTTAPGLEGLTLRVERSGRQSEQWRSSLGFGAEFTLKEPVFNGYWGLALTGGALDDTIDLVADNGRPVQLTLRRDVLALRAGRVD